MAFLDFLTEGQPIPAGSGVTATNTQKLLPSWYTNYAMDLLSRQNNVLATPYTTYGGPRVADLTPMQRSAANLAQTGSTAYQPALDTATSAVSNALTPGGGLTAAMPYINPAVAATRGIIGQNAASNAAYPYMSQASRGTDTRIRDFMNPYTDAVVKRIGEVGARTLHENILPGIQDRFIQAGQGVSGSRQGLEFGRGVRDTMESIVAEQARALEQGYNTSLTAAQNEAQRYGSLAGTAGNLATSDTGATAGAASALSNLGVNVGNLFNSGSAQTIAGANALANLGGQAQNLALTGAGALSQYGGQQQALNQQNVDVAYQDFLRQQGYPQAQIDAALATFKDAGAGAPSLEQQWGVQPLGYAQQNAPSTLTQIGSAGSGLASLLEQWGKLK